MIKVNLTFLLSICLLLLSGLDLVLFTTTPISSGSQNPSSNSKIMLAKSQVPLDHQITLSSFKNTSGQIQELSTFTDNSNAESLMQASLIMATESAKPSVDSTVSIQASPEPSTTPIPVVASILPAIASSSATPSATASSSFGEVGKTIKPSPTIRVRGLDADKIFEMVNAHRESLNLPDLKKDDKACTLANSRAPEINNEVATSTMHKGLKDRNLDYWNSENIISMDSEKAAFNWWIHDKIHKDAIEGDYKYSCVACSGYACAQEFTNFQPK